MLNIIIDTNVIISALLGKRTRPLFFAIKNRACNLIISPFIFEEIAEVLHRPKFKNKISQEDANNAILFIENNAYFVKPSKKLLVCRDKEDNPILECAVEASKHFANIAIASDDKDLLVLSPFEGIPIITSQELLARIRK